MAAGATAPAIGLDDDEKYLYGETSGMVDLQLFYFIYLQKGETYVQQKFPRFPRKIVPT